MFLLLQPNPRRVQLMRSTIQRQANKEFEFTDRRRHSNPAVLLSMEFFRFNSLVVPEL